MASLNSTKRIYYSELTTLPLSEAPLSPLLECNDSFSSFVFVTEREDKKFNINISLLETFIYIGTKNSGFSNKRFTSLLSASLGESSERKTNASDKMLKILSKLNIIVIIKVMPYDSV